MQVVLTPHYKDLFPDDNDTIEELLDGIPSSPILQLLALMDAELYSKDDGQLGQLKLFNLILERQTAELRIQIIKNAFGDLARDTQQRQFFGRHYNLNFMHYIMVNYREGDLVEITPEQEFRIFKAYFLIAQEFGQQPQAKELLPAFDEDYFAKMMWPSLADSFEINFRVHPYHIVVRGIVFLNYFQFHSNYAKYVEAYLKKHNKKTTLNYVLDIFQMLNSNFESIRQGKNFASFTLGRSPGFESLFEQFTIDPSEYARQFSRKKENYAGIKSRPLYKLNEDTWLVLSWTFLNNKLYEGLIFDFYNVSGIAAAPEFKQFVNFKQFIGENITEKHLFRSLAEKALQKKYDVLLFDNGDTPGFPDVYYRKGNKVFLFEIKDAYFPSSAINSFSYDLIKEAIDLKVNSSGKGSGQLIKQLQALNERPFESPQRYKSPAHLTVYPIIIYTDIHFNMPGVNEYVNRSFSKMLTDANLRTAFRKVMPLTMMNVNYMIGIFDVLQDASTSLETQIDFFHHEISNRRKKHNRTQSLTDHQAIYDVFENVTTRLIKRDDFNRKYIEWITNALKLYEGLPSV